MVTISPAKLAGNSLIWGPVITVICYFYQQTVIYADVEWGNAASWAVAAAGGGAAMVIMSMIIPLALMVLVYGFFFIANEIRAGGNGAALVGYAMPMLLIAITGWALAAGITITVTNFPDPAAAAAAAMLAANGINGIAGLFFSIGAAALFFAMASRAEYNSTLANAAGLIALLAAVLTIIGTVSTGLNQIMTQIVGMTYIIHTIYSIYIGRGILARG